MSQHLGRLVAALFLAVVACSPSSKGSGRKVDSLRACVPNQQIVCRCDIDDGIQTCTSEGLLTPCDCKPTTNPDTPLPGPPDEGGPDRPAACGNGRIDLGEACDDGNETSGDGCSANCQPDGSPPSGETCPGQPVTLWKGGAVVLSGTTTAYADDSDVSCEYSYGADRVYAVRVSAGGIMTIDAAFSDGFPAFVDIHKDKCAEFSTSILCEDTLAKPFKRVVPVEEGSTYYVFVDADYANPTGAYSIRLELP